MHECSFEWPNGSSLDKFWHGPSVGLTNSLHQMEYLLDLFSKVGRPRALRHLAALHLGCQIQEGEHNSVCCLIFYIWVSLFGMILSSLAANSCS
jgi:hypothetical protein